MKTEPFTPDVAPALARRHFTVHQANRSLVLVRRIVEDITGGYAHLLELQEAIEAARDQGTRLTGAEADLIETAEKLHGCIQELDDLGAELKDWTAGVVDFPSLAGGREVRLCWRQGEDHVEFWHEVSAAFKTRRSLHTLPVEDPAAALMP